MSTVRPINSKAAEAGYSETPLATKLGASESSRCLVVGPAADAVLTALPHAHRRPGRAPYDVIVAFCPDRRALERHVAAVWSGFRFVHRRTPR